MGSVTAGRSLFQEEWWIGASAGDKGHEVSLIWDSQIVGSMKYFMKSRYGFTIIKNPPYTRFLPPSLSPPVSKDVTLFRNSVKIVQGLTTQLPRFQYLELQIGNRPDLAYAFARAGFLVKLNFTFESAPCETLDSLWERADKRLRSAIRSARQHLSTKTIDIDNFVRMCKEQYQVRDRNDYEALQRIWREASARNQAAIISVQDESGHHHAAGLLVWDFERLYFLVAARSSSSKLSGATRLLVWECIRLAKSKGLTMDLDGFATSRTASVLSQFGCTLTVRHVVISGSPLAIGLMFLRKKLAGELS